MSDNTVDVRLTLPRNQPNSMDFREYSGLEDLWYTIEMDGNHAKSPNS